MTDADLNRAIAEALGMFPVEQVGWGVGTSQTHYLADDSTGEPIPDYANNLNATMAVIRELWPDAIIMLGKDFVSIRKPSGYSITGEWTESKEGDTDARRLANAFMEALNA